jgi:hypothetical protein
MSQNEPDTTKVETPKSQFGLASLMPKEGSLIVGTVTLISGKPGPLTKIEGGKIVPA